MTIKVGDRVKCVNRYSQNDGKTGIVVGIKDDGKINVYFTITDWTFDVSELELAEVAHYVPVPKFKVGDIVYDKNGKKYLILEEREDDLFYHCWAYANDNDFFREEKELTLEEPKEQLKNE